MEIRILGPLEVVGQGGPIDVGGGRRRALFSLLTVNAGRAVSPDLVVDSLWGDEPTDAAVRTVKTYISRLRKILTDEPGISLDSVPAGYTLSLTDPCAVDAHTFEGAAKGASRTTDPAHRLEQIECALRLWRGDPLPELIDHPWAGAERRRLSTIHRGLQRRQAGTLVDLGHEEAAGQLLETLVACYPHDEDIACRLAILRYCTSGSAAALEVISSTSNRLREDLGVDPGADLAVLELRILDHDPGLTADLDEDASGEPAPTTAGPSTTAVEAWADARPTAPPVPPSLVAASLDHLVGREAELASGDRCIESVAAYGTATLLLSGEAGIGKTSLVAELGRHAHDAGLSVMHGWCEQGMAAAYQPFIGAVRGWARPIPADELREACRGLTGELRRVLPDLPLSGEALAPVGGPDEERLRLLDALVDLLHQISQRSPTVLVLEDLHWAAEPTVLLLRHVVGAGIPGLLVVGSHRGEDIEEASGLRQALAQMSRSPAVHQLTLEGLDAHELLELAQDAGVPPTDEMASWLEAETDGNPFFASELLRGMGESSGGLIPTSIRDTVRERLNRLPPTNRSFLLGAAILGEDFDIGAAARMAGLENREALEILAAAEDRRLVRGVDGRRWIFRHALVRDAVVADLPMADRVESEDRASRALEAVGSPNTAAIAAHALAGRVIGGVARAVEWSELAAQEAIDQLAFEDAVRLSHQAQRALTETRSAEGDVLLRLRLLEGEALRGVGDLVQAQHAYAQAVDIAGELGRGDVQADAALGWIEPPEDLEHMICVPELRAEHVRQIEAALTALDDPHDARTPRLLAARAVTKFDVGNDRGGLPLMTDALALADRSGDVSTQCYVRRMRLRTWLISEPAEVRLEHARELLRLASDTGSPDEIARAHYWHLAPCAELGDLDGVRRHLALIEDAAEALRSPFHRWTATVGRVALASMRGDFEHAEELLTEAVIGAEQLGSLWSINTTLSVEMRHRENIGRIEFTPSIPYPEEIDVSPTPPDPNPFGLLYLIPARRALADGDLDRARSLTEPWMSTDMVHALRDVRQADHRRWATMLVEMATALDDTAACTWLRLTLEPSADRFAVHAGTLDALLGSYRYHLGLIDETLGNLEGAAEQLTRANQAEATIGARPAAARSRWALARVLDLLGDQSAHAVADEAMSAARELGMERLGWRPEDAVVG